jgi:hypothetical protein
MPRRGIRVRTTWLFEERLIGPAREAVDHLEAAIWVARSDARTTPS